MAASAEAMNGGGQGGSSWEDSVQRRIPPLAVDDNLMEDVRSEGEEDVEDEIERYGKGGTARTVFHQRRGENDTMYAST